MMFLAVIASICLAIVGIVQLFSGDFFWGIVLLVAACAVGPGGMSIWNSRRGQ